MEFRKMAFDKDSIRDTYKLITDQYKNDPNLNDSDLITMLGLTFYSICHEEEVKHAFNSEELYEICQISSKRIKINLLSKQEFQKSFQKILSLGLVNKEKLGYGN